MTMNTTASRCCEVNVWPELISFLGFVEQVKLFWLLASVKVFFPHLFRLFPSLLPFLVFVSFRSPRVKNFITDDIPFFRSFFFLLLIVSTFARQLINLWVATLHSITLHCAATHWYSLHYKSITQQSTSATFAKWKLILIFFSQLFIHLFSLVLIIG